MSTTPAEPVPGGKAGELPLALNGRDSRAGGNSGIPLSLPPDSLPGAPRGCMVPCTLEVCALRGWHISRVYIACTSSDMYVGSRHVGRGAVCHSCIMHVTHDSQVMAVTRCMSTGCAPCTGIAHVSQVCHRRADRLDLPNASRTNKTFTSGLARGARRQASAEVAPGSACLRPSLARADNRAGGRRLGGSLCPLDLTCRSRGPCHCPGLGTGSPRGKVRKVQPGGTNRAGRRGVKRLGAGAGAGEQ